jgi:outer membrane protein TolC
VADTPQKQPLQWVAADQIAQAYEQSPTYLKQQILLAQEEERLLYASDQLNPQLDLKGSYGFSGLGSNYGDSFGVVKKNNYPKWSVGVSFSAPLGVNRRAQSEYNATQMRKMYSSQRLQTIRVELEAAIYAAGEQVSRGWEQVVALRQAAVNTKQQFQAAQKELNAGTGTVRMVLERESEHNRLQEMLLTAIVSYQKSILALSGLDGTLLLDLQLESNSDEYDSYMSDTTNFGMQ